MRQVRMQVERIDSLQKMKALDRGFDLDWRGRAIRLRFRTQPEPVRDWQAQGRQQRAGESGETLLRRDRSVAMMQERGRLEGEALIVWEAAGVADVVVGQRKARWSGSARKARSAAASSALAAWPVRSELKLMTLSVSAPSSKAASSGLRTPSSPSRSTSTIGRPVARACSTKVPKFIFMM